MHIQWMVELLKKFNLEKKRKLNFIVEILMSFKSEDIKFANLKLYSYLHIVLMYLVNFFECMLLWTCKLTTILNIEFLITFLTCDAHTMYFFFFLKNEF